MMGGGISVIAIDTNVLSALMSRGPDRDVVAWLNQQAPESVRITSITVFEIRLGLALMDAGAQRIHCEAVGEVWAGRTPTERMQAVARIVQRRRNASVRVREQAAAYSEDSA